MAKRIYLKPTNESNLNNSHLANRVVGVLIDKPRPGHPANRMTRDILGLLIALACSDPPEGYDRWELRLLADYLVSLELVDSVSHVAVGDTLKKPNLSIC
jgi:hypothetical protein